MNNWCIREEAFTNLPDNPQFRAIVNTVHSVILDFRPSFSVAEFRQASGQKEKTALIKKFNSELGASLSMIMNPLFWETEVVEPGSRDRYDLHITMPEDQGGIQIVIEVDAHRADQVAKKFVSRSARFADVPFIYVALVYPGTRWMNAIECRTYFGHCATLSNKLSTQEHPKAFLAFQLSAGY